MKKRGEVGTNLEDHLIELVNGGWYEIDEFGPYQRVQEPTPFPGPGPSPGPFPPPPPRPGDPGYFKIVYVKIPF